MTITSLELVAVLSALSAPVVAGETPAINEASGVIAPQREAGMTCQEVASIVAATLSPTGREADVITTQPPPFPTVAEHRPDGSLQIVPLTRSSPFWKEGWTGERPSDSLIDLWFAAPYHSVAECLPGKGERKLGELAGMQEGRASTPATQAKDKSPARIQITEPVVDKSRSYALAFYSLSESTGLGGRVELVLLSHNNSSWKKVGSRILSVS
ncbi:MAG: hypothetical protein V4610_15455 [Pseudomonadota bacterium]